MEGEPLTILLIEDNLDHARLILRNFKNTIVANKIFHIEDGDSAIQYLEGLIEDENINNLKPNLILLDLRLPRVDGLEVLKYIKTSEKIKNIPVVILTTSDADKDIAKAYNLHANSYLVKPVNFESFTKMMSDLGFYWLGWNRNPY